MLTLKSLRMLSKPILKGLVVLVVLLQINFLGLLKQGMFRVVINGEDSEAPQVFMVQLTLPLQEVRQYMQQVVGL